MMRFALLVTTLGRRPEMRRLLQSLTTQTCRTFRVYVADQSAGALDTLWSTFRPRLDLRVLPVERKGVSHARNTLLRACSRDVWDAAAFPDDDCWYGPDVLAAAAAWFAVHARADVLLANRQEDPQAALPPDLPTRVTPCGVFRRGETYVQFYRRRAVETIGTWDERLGPGTGLPYGCGEDTDYLLRGLRNGLSVRRENDIVVFHPEVRLDAEEIPRWRAYGRGRMQLLRKHGFPFWFKLANLAYPLWRLLREPARCRRYRLHMFYGRFSGWLLKSDV